MWKDVSRKQDGSLWAWKMWRTSRTNRERDRHCEVIVGHLHAPKHQWFFRCDVLGVGASSCASRDLVDAKKEALAYCGAKAGDMLDDLIDEDGGRAAQEERMSRLMQWLNGKEH